MRTCFAISTRPPSAHAASSPVTARGRAISVQARGNLAAAEQSLREIAAEAQGVEEREIQAHAEHALGTTLLFRGQIADAIVHVWRGFELYEDDASRVRALGDLGAMLLTVGEVTAAERALGEVG